MPRSEPHRGGRPHTDTPIFMLDHEERFRLAADRLQWIVQRCKGVTRKGANEGKGVYRGHRFCTTRAVHVASPDPGEEEVARDRQTRAW